MQPAGNLKPLTSPFLFLFGISAVKRVSVTDIDGHGIFGFERNQPIGCRSFAEIRNLLSPEISASQTHEVSVFFRVSEHDDAVSCMLSELRASLQIFPFESGSQTEEPVAGHWLFEHNAIATSSKRLEVLTMPF